MGSSCPKLGLKWPTAIRRCWGHWLQDIRTAKADGIRTGGRDKAKMTMPWLSKHRGLKRAFGQTGIPEIDWFRLAQDSTKRSSSAYKAFPPERGEEPERDLDK